MKRQRVLVITKGDDIEVWGSLTEACEHHPPFVYAYVKNLTPPFTYKGCEFRRVDYRIKKINL